ncbi:MAG: hypothetical protein WC497_05520 [Patescibacteria group bacterium]
MKIFNEHGKPNPVEQDGVWFEPTERRAARIGEDYWNDHCGRITKCGGCDNWFSTWIMFPIPAPVPEQLKAIGMKLDGDRPRECNEGDKIWHGRAVTYYEEWEPMIRWHLVKDEPQKSKPKEYYPINPGKTIRFQDSGEYKNRLIELFRTDNGWFIKASSEQVGEIITHKMGLTDDAFCALLKLYACYQEENKIKGEPAKATGENCLNCGRDNRFYCIPKCQGWIPRPPVAQAGPGGEYIYLKEGDVIKEGDEFELGKGNWVATGDARQIVSALKIRAGIIYRRKVEPVQPPRGEDATAKLPDCFFCHKPQTKPGGLLFGPPNDEDCSRKIHVCVDCWSNINPYPRTAKVEDVPKSKEADSMEYVRTWWVILNLCEELGLDMSGKGTPVERIVAFIRSLSEKAKTPKVEDTPDYQSLWQEIRFCCENNGMNIPSSKANQMDIIAFIQSLARKAGEERYSTNESCTHW